jgi:PAS domain S-box-containing protein
MSEAGFSKRALPVLLRYGLAVLCVSLALLLTHVLGRLIEATPGILIFVAVVISARYGGRGPGLVAIALSAFALHFAFISPNTILTSSMANLPRLTLFVLSALLISSLVAARKRAEDALRQARDKLEIEVEERTSELAKTNDALQAEITERNMAERARERLLQELKTERAFLEAILRQMPAGVVIAEAPSGKVILGNKQVEEMLRHDFSLVDEVEKYEAYACYSADGRAYKPEEMPLARSTLTGEVVNGEEINFVRGDGSIGKVALSSCPIRDHEGKIIAGVAVFHDITERKRAEDSIRQSEERFSKAFNASPHPMTITTLDDGRYLDVNDALLRDVGYSREEIIGRTATELNVYIDEADRARVLRALEERGNVRDLEVKFRARDGETLFFSLSADIISLNDQRCLLTASHNITERKRAEAAIKASEHRLSLIYESVGDSLFLLSVEEGDCYRFVSVNEAFLTVTGFSKEQVIDKRIEEVLPESSHTLVISKYGEAIRGNKTVRWEEVAMLPAGKRVGEVIVTPMTDDVTGKLHLIGAVHDITERKRAEEATRLNEKQYRTLADAVPQLVWMNNADGERQYYNRRWKEYTGLTPDEQKGLIWLKAVHADDAQLIVEARASGLQSGEAYEGEYRLRRADGSYRWHLARTVPMKDDDGEVLQWFGTATDIHDIKRTEESNRFLSEAGALLASSLDEEVTIKSMAQIAVPYLADWCIVDLVKTDGSIERISGKHSDPSKEKWLAGVLKNLRYDYHSESGCCVPEVLRTGKPQIANEISEEWLKATAYDSEHFKILRELGFGSYMVVPLVARGRTFGAISLSSVKTNRYSEPDLALAQDVAHRAALAIDNARLYREAQEANRLKDEFLATVSHELRTPLNAILGWAEILRTGKLDESGKEHALSTIVRNGKSQAQLIEDILDVSRIITGKLRLDVRPLGLAPVINAAIDAVRPAAFAKEIDFQVSLEESPSLVSGDPNRLQQVIWNLLANAIKFTPAKGTIRVTLEQSDSNAQLVVSDTGAGIKAEFLPHVFDRFSQADRSYTRTHGGLGLGLAVVRYLVEMHGGTVRAESEGEGKGATFVIRLPLSQTSVANLRPESQINPPADQQSAPSTEGATRRTHYAGSRPDSQSKMLAGLWLLVVDDEPDALELISAVLEQCGATVTAVESAARGLGVLAGCERGKRPDVILSDIGMPGEDGLSFIERVRAIEDDSEPMIPAIALTAYARAEDRARALRAGYQIHIAKPFEPAQLVTAISSIVQQSRKGFGN